MNEEREWLMIEDLDLNLTGASDAELEQFISRLRYSRTRDKSFAGTSPIEIALHLVVAAAEKNSRSAAKQTAEAIRLSKAAIILATVSAMFSLIGIWK